MNRHATLTICAFLAVNMLVGCNSLRPMASNDVDVDDPLAIDRKVSPTFKMAKRELDKSATSTIMKFARWREDMSDFEEAKKQYMDVLADNPDHLGARLGVARVEYSTGHKQEAEKILVATTKKFPNAANAWVELGRVYSSQEKWEQAVASFRSAVKTDSSDRLANYELGVALARSGELEDAHRYLAVAGGDSAAYYNVGYILHEAGRSQDAADWTRKALASKPDEKTRASAEQLLTTLGRTLSPLPSPSDKTMLASASKAGPFVDQSRTSYREYTESPGPDGFIPASMTVQQPPVATNNATGAFGSTASNAGVRPFGGQSVLPANATGHAVAPTSFTAAPIHTANLQRSTNSFPQQQGGFQQQNGFQQQQQAPSQWNGPASNNQPLVSPAPTIRPTAEFVQPQTWRSN